MAADPVFIVYPTEFPTAAALAAVAIARGTSTLSVNAKVNALEAVQMYGVGQALPLATATPPAPPRRGTQAPLPREEFAALLQAHCNRSASERAAMAGAIDWAAVVAAAMAFIQALISSGVI